MSKVDTQKGEEETFKSSVTVASTHPSTINWPDVC